MRKHHLIDLNDLTKTQWEQITELAIRIKNSPDKYADSCRGKILATLFYEPSTRTQMSFQTAMLRLGGSVIGFDNPQNSSVSKGENLVDTITIVSGYADIIAMRHPVEGAALAGAQYSRCPLINAGDGGHLHPTQTLTDLVTLASEIGDLNHLTIGLCGDLKFGRTVHSLIKALSHYKGMHFVLISTDALTLPDRFKEIIRASSNTYEECCSLEDAMSSLDVLYMTRIQKERFASEKLYNEQKNVYILTPDKLTSAKPELKILHPLPRVDEIAMEVDNDPRAIYFRQARYGVYARMALILTLLNAGVSEPVLKGISHGQHCKNPRCVTNNEPYLKSAFVMDGGLFHCEYCDAPLLL